MKKLSRDSWLAIGLFVTLVVITAAAATQQTGQAEAIPLSSASSAPTGARALHLWLADLHYTVSADVPEAYQFSRTTRLIFILEPTDEFAPAEWQALDKWVEEGGVLVLAGEGLATTLAASHYDFNLNYLETETAALAAQAPLWLSPPLTTSALIRTRAYFQTSRADFVAHLAIGAEPVVVSFPQGTGHVILSATAYPFSNAGLKEVGNPAFVLNLVSVATRGGRIWFDEWHHGLRENPATLVGPGDWLRFTAAGRSLLFVVLVVFLALVLRGRRFGRPVPLSRETARRAPLEYITAIANLNRRAGHRRAVLGQYHQQLKRQQGHRYRLDPTLHDAEFVARLARFNPKLDANALRQLLTRLQRSTVSESEMIQLAAEVAEWTKESV